VVCEECEETRVIDGDIPACETEKGCLIPPLSENGARVMAMRQMLIRLKELVDPGTILAMHGASLHDLEMLAEAEELIEQLKPGGNQNG
jgi:hypothetical protein